MSLKLLYEWPSLTSEQSSMNWKCGGLLGKPQTQTWSPLPLSVVAFLPCQSLVSFQARIWFAPTSLFSAITLNHPLPPPATVTLLWRFRPGMGVRIWQGRWREGWGLFIWVLAGRWIRYRCLAVVKERVSLYMPTLLVICIALRLCPPNRYPDFLSVCLDPR